MLLLLQGYAVFRLPIGASPKYARGAAKRYAEEEEMRLSTALAEKLAASNEVTQALLKTNQQLIEANKQLLEMKRIQQVDVKPEPTPQELEAKRLFAEKMKAAREAKNAEAEAKKKEFLKRMKKGKKKAAKQRSR